VTANLDLLARFFDKYPEYTSKAFLSVKGGVSLENLQSDLSPEALRRSVDNVLKHLDGKKRLDLFQPARMDPKVPIEEVMTTLSGLVKEGKFDFIGLSELVVMNFHINYDLRTFIYQGQSGDHQKSTQNSSSGSCRSRIL
jgi:aryl-alcohol dehydrogenase-like predicted oxidoreductase